MRALSKTLAVAALAAIGSFAVEHATAVPSAATARPGAPAPSFGGLVSPYGYRRAAAIGHRSQPLI